MPRIHEGRRPGAIGADADRGHRAERVWRQQAAGICRTLRTINGE